MARSNCFRFSARAGGKAAVLEENTSIVRIITTRVNRHTRSTGITEPSARAQVSRKDANRIPATITRKLEDVCQTRRPTVTLNAISAVTRRFRAAPSDLAPISRGFNAFASLFRISSLQPSNPNSAYAIDDTGIVQRSVISSPLATGSPPISLRPPVGTQHCRCYANASLVGR